MAKPKIGWTIKSLIAGIVSGGIAYYYSQNRHIAFFILFFTTIIVFLHDPKRRFIRFAWALFWMILALNKYFFEFAGNLAGVKFKVGANEVDYRVSIVLALMMGLALFLDFLEQKDKLPKGLFSKVENTFTNSKNNVPGKINAKRDVHIGDKN
ncbi:hypothetical protein BKI52_36620 [marine bacterium AO1-C]|nr:hypothetical protein BKI52_36620 [marine bacterium AO1-C]